MVYIGYPVYKEAHDRTYWHMMADSKSELESMARRLNLKKEWIHQGTYPHYDIPLKEKNMALRFGAVEMSLRSFVDRMKLTGKDLLKDYGR